MDFKELVEKHGASNLMFMASMRPLKRILGFIAYKSSNDPEVIVPCVIDTTSRYNVNDNYKVTLKSTLDGYGTEHWYISDLTQSIRAGHVQVFVKPTLSYPLAPQE